MRAVGEVMSIGKNFKEAFQKAIRSLETGRYGLGHAKDFEKAFGVKRNDVGSYLKKVIQNGTVISNKVVSIGSGKQGYERVYEYKGNYYTMTGIGTNGFIVSAYPVRKDDL